MEANRECPRFDRCSVNNCPLTTRYPDWPIVEWDAEKRCTLGKRRRHEIGKKYGLRMQGLTPREWSTKQRMESMSPEELQNLRDRGKKLAGTLNLSVQTENGSGI